LGSRHISGWLAEHNISLAFTTYQLGKLFVVGRKAGEQFSVFERTFSRCMGLWADGPTIWMSSAYQLWRLENTLKPGHLHNGYDALYVPRVGYTTGDVDMHDLAVEQSGRVVFVNTSFSCLATLSSRFSFQPLWRPSFVSKLAPEDRCHLNGLALVEGRAAYVTAVSQSDVADGWRSRRADGGGMSGYGGGMYGGGMSGYGGGMYGSASGYSGTAGVAGATTTAPAYPGASATVGAMSGNLAGRSGMGADMTGNYLGMEGYGGLMPGSTQFGPRITPNISDNSLLILATPEQYESVEKLLHQLDVPPRQVLIEAQILEVTLTGQFSSGIQAWLQQVGATNPGTVPGSTSSAARALIGAFDGATTTLSAGTLVGQSRQLFGLLTAQEGSGRTKVVSTPRLIATDSIPAFINVGDTVPTLSSQAVTGAQSSGSSLFANTIQNVSTGTTLNLTARVNPSGVVTLLIDQEVSAPIAASSNGIQSPSFSQRTVKTQVTVEDGDMIAIGGIISETKTDSSSGIPFLYKIPFIGAAFGNKSITTNRTEMVIFLTPHVIYDTTGLAEASDDLVRGMKRVQKLVRE